MKLSTADTASLLLRNPMVSRTSRLNSRASYSRLSAREETACSNARAMASSAAGVFDWARRPRTLMRVAESTASPPETSELDHFRLHQLCSHPRQAPLDGEIVVPGVPYQAGQRQTLER